MVMQSLYGHVSQGLIISLFHKRIKGIAVLKLDSHVWILPYTLRSTELHASSPARYAPAMTKYL